MQRTTTTQALRQTPGRVEIDRAKRPQMTANNCDLIELTPTGQNRKQLARVKPNQGWPANYRVRADSRAMGRGHVGVAIKKCNACV